MVLFTMIELCSGNIDFLNDYPPITKQKTYELLNIHSLLCHGVERY